jgi:dTDP-4-dehydrorhamnose reductase
MVAEVFLRDASMDVVLACRNPQKWRSSCPRIVVVDEFDAELDSAGERLDELLRCRRPAFIVNCIGIIKPYCRDGDIVGRSRAVFLNGLFPYRLQSAAGRHGARIVQIATDCVYDGAAGGYTEKSQHNALDVYGKTKSLGEVPAANFLNIRCSVVGPEKHNRLSLLEWFLGHPDGSVVSGYAHHRWNGVTSLQFAELCRDIVLGESGLAFDALRCSGAVLHYVPNETVTKYDLCNLFAQVYGRSVIVRRVTDEGMPIDRSLGAMDRVLLCGRSTMSMKVALQQLREYTAECNFYG